MSAQLKTSRICVPLTEMQYWPQYIYEDDYDKDISTSMCICGLTGPLCQRIRSEKQDSNSAEHHFFNVRPVSYVFMTLRTDENVE